MPFNKHRKTDALSSTLNSANCSSPLKIESVLPTVNRSSSKSIYRSYSTLSSGHLKKPTNISSIANDLEHRLQNAQSKLSGFWHIQRTAKEKEKLPDRINLDRRGLTAIPVIDNEPQLRLLSLQHNLINSFSVPEVIIKEKETIHNQTLDECRPLPTTDDSMAKQTKVIGSNKKHVITKSNLINIQRNSNKNHLGNNAKSPTAATIHTHHSTLHGHHIIKNSFIQKTVHLHAKEKYIFRKSSSFMNSYSKHLAASKIHLEKLMDSNAKSNMEISVCTDLNTSDSESKISNLNQNPASPKNANHVKLTPPSYVSNSPTAHNNMSNRNEDHLENLMICSENVPVNNLQNLVFIDLYDNQIEKISSLEGLKSLTVLLLGKNRISDISGLITVKQTLRVLDLHGNKIAGISQKICQLQELKSLNLAGNNLKTVYFEDFKGLFNLRELNLKRNHIKRINGFEDLRNLERLWLCHNDLQKVDDMQCIAKAINLKEVTLDNNPVSLGGDCVSFLVSYLPCLVLLSQMHVTEQVRRAAMAWRLSKETSDANYSHLSNDVSQNQRREEIISNARTNWELLRSQHNNHVAKSSTAQNSYAFDGKSNKVPPKVDIDAISHVSETLKCENRKSAIMMARQKTISNRAKSLKKTNYGRHQKRSMSHENIVEMQQDTDKIPDSQYFRLPPILSTFLVDGATQKVSTSSTSGSSLSPNVDSSSSVFSSDNDNKEDELFDADLRDEENADEYRNDLVASQLIKDINDEIVQKDNQLRSPRQDTVRNADDMYALSEFSEAVDGANDEMSSTPPSTLPGVNADDINSDKASDISYNSNKSNISEPVTEDLFKSAKCRNANSGRRRYVSALAQTARNTSINISNKTVIKNQPVPVSNEREREQGGDYLIEICGRYLNVYGTGALKFIDRQWNIQKAADVHTFKFSYIHFNSIASILGKVKMRFPNAENFVFRETNINCLGQLNALAEIQGIHSLIIDPEGNHICTKPDWRLYAIYRLSHWGVKYINGEDVTEQEIAEAHHMYSGLSKLVFWSLPDVLLEPLLTRLHLDESCTSSSMSAKQWLMQADESLRSVVGKEALQWKKGFVGTAITSSALSGATGNGAPDEFFLRQHGIAYFKRLMENTCNATEKLNKLETLWPMLLIEMIRNTLLDYSQLEVYVRNLMVELLAVSPKSINTRVSGSSSWRPHNNQLH